MQACSCSQRRLIKTMMYTVHCHLQRQHHSRRQLQRHRPFHRQRWLLQLVSLFIQEFGKKLLRVFYSSSSLSRFHSKKQSMIFSEMVCDYHAVLAAMIPWNSCKTQADGHSYRLKCPIMSPVSNIEILSSFYLFYVMNNYDLCVFLPAMLTIRAIAIEKYVIPYVCRWANNFAYARA